MNTVPTEMRALQLDAYHDDLSEALRSLKVVRKPTPQPQSGQVLVRVEAAPCNPSDLLLLLGRYGKKKILPATPGWEGAGTVVASGGGLFGRWLVGKRVAFSIQSDGDGTWTQYAVVDAKMCIPLKKDVSTEQGACLIINPLTALGLVDKAIQGKHKAIIQNAAASQVGKMVLQLAKQKGIPAIHIVRRKEQEDLLKSFGADIVLNSESPTFEQDLKKEAHRLKATVAFDAVAGPMTGLILRAMPSHSKILVYGALSGKSCMDINPLSLIFQESSVGGFYLSEWIESKNVWELYRATSTVQKLIADGTFHTSISAEVSFEEAPKALEVYSKEMTGGKVLIKPHL